MQYWYQRLRTNVQLRHYRYTSIGFFSYVFLCQTSKYPGTWEKIYLIETYHVFIFLSFLSMSPEIISALTSFCVDQVYGKIVFVFTQSRNKPFSKSDQIKPYQKPSISHRKPMRNNFKKKTKRNISSKNYFPSLNKKIAFVYAVLKWKWKFAYLYQFAN